MSLRRRLARLLQQSRIRLPRHPVKAAELSPGDRIQLGSRTWRVLSWSRESGRVVVRLCAVDGGEPAVIETSRRPDEHWMLRSSEGTTRLSPELLVVFPVGVP